MFSIEENLRKLPDLPGVYIHKDKLGQVIYVGKAISLKNRVRQYFQKSAQTNRKTRALVENIAEFEWITCSNEMEALVLECNLIKRYMPKYNVLLRDDKTYPYIMVTTTEEYPRLLKTRTIKNDGNKYFGPYTDVGAVNRIIQLLNDTYSLKRCNLISFPKDFRPCLNYHINLCQGICTGQVDKQAYNKEIGKVLEYLRGKDSELRKTLSERMLRSSENLQFEQAAKYRDLMKDLEALVQVQRVTILGESDLDMVLALSSENNKYIVLFNVRQGKVSGRETFEIQADKEEQSKDIVANFLKQYYSQWAIVPREILIEEEIDDKSLIEEYLSREGRKVRLIKPERGAKKNLIRMAQRDREQLRNTIKLKAESNREKAATLQEQMTMVMEKAGGEVKKGDYRIEAYDISNTNGVDTVGAMVVFSGLKPVRKDYRRFKIRTAETHDDYGSLQEVLYRRFNRAINGDKSFKTMPDIIFMDGGLGQVNAAKAVLSAMSIDIPVVGLAKDNSHRTRAMVFGSGEEIRLNEIPFLFSYCGTIQEEVHRFVIDYHRKLRGNHAIGSVLDNISGIGPVKRNALLSHFDTIDAIKSATLKELMGVQGITEKNAKAIIDFFAIRH